MAEKIGGPREPMDKGHIVGQIDTPMCPENVQRKNTPGIHTYKGTMEMNSPGGPALATGSEIVGPGEKGKLPQKR